MTDRYAVVGNPVEHSKSPLIHAAFAAQTAQDIAYGRILAPLDGFAAAITQLRAEGYKGCNVTVPFKFEAFRLVPSENLSEPAKLAQAVNTLSFDDHGIHGANTDGIGLVNDIRGNLGIRIEGGDVLLVGAGGAAFGVLMPLLAASPRRLILSNRTMAKAEEAVALLRTILSRAEWSSGKPVEVQAKSFAELAGESFDIVINSTSTGLAGESLPLPEGLFNPESLAYDMMYGRETPFMAFARAQGARVADGLGMLVEQAAESFFLWRGIRPETAPVIAQLRG